MNNDHIMRAVGRATHQAQAAVTATGHTGNCDCAFCWPMRDALKGLDRAAAEVVGLTDD